MAGIIAGLDPDRTVLGFSVLKGAEFLERRVVEFANGKMSWQILHEYHGGGYGKVTDQLLQFIVNAKRQFDLPLDSVYTSKMMKGIFDLVQRRFFRAGSKVLMLHTGGLQGNY